MKKLLLIAAVGVFGFTNVNAQDDSVSTSQTKFGLKAGYSSVILKVSVEDESASEDVSGFYVGGFAEINLSNKFNLQPELLYSSFSQDGQSTDVLILPILAEYKADEKFAIQAGPQFDYLLSEEDSEGLKRIGFGLALGLSYDITENVIFDARYSFGLSDRLDEDLEGFEEFDIKTKFNYFQVGLGYRF